jgi:hypothetical protein
MNSLPLATESPAGGKKARPHPGLLPQEKESLFPRLVNLIVLRLRVVQGFNARNFRGILSPSVPQVLFFSLQPSSGLAATFSPEGLRGRRIAEREKRFQRLGDVRRL